MDFFENVTLFRKKPMQRSQSLSDSTLNECDLTCSNMTLDGTTHSLPNISDEENCEQIEKLKSEIYKLRTELDAARHEINNLSMVNVELKKSIHDMNVKYDLVKKANKKLSTDMNITNTTNKKNNIKNSTPSNSNRQTLPSTPPNQKDDLHNNRASIIATNASQKLDTTLIEDKRNPSFTPNKVCEEFNADSNKQKMMLKPKQKNKLCIMSSNNVLEPLPLIENIFSDHFSYCRYIYPNSTTKHIIRNIDKKLDNYTFEDYCLIFIGENDIRGEVNYISLINDIRESLRKIKHTNIVICLPTFITGSPIYNYKVEIFNNLMDLDLQNNNYAYIFDSNRDLTLDMFSLKSGRVNKHGMRNIYNRIMDNILVDLHLSAVEIAREITQNNVQSNQLFLL